MGTSRVGLRGKAPRSGSHRPFLEELPAAAREGRISVCATGSLPSPLADCVTVLVGSVHLHKLFRSQREESLMYTLNKSGCLPDIFCSGFLPFFPSDSWSLPLD